MFSVCAERRRALTCLAVVLLLAACGGGAPETPERQVRARIEQGRQLAEQRDSGGLAELLSEDFRGPRGMSRHDVRALLLRLFFRYRHPHYLVRIKRIEPLPDGRFSVQLLVAMSATSVNLDQLSDLRARLLAIDLVFRREDDDWRIERAAWRNAAVTDFLT